MSGSEGGRITHVAAPLWSATQHILTASLIDVTPTLSLMWLIYLCNFGLGNRPWTHGTHSPTEFIRPPDFALPAKRSPRRRKRTLAASKCLLSLFLLCLSSPISNSSSVPSFLSNLSHSITPEPPPPPLQSSSSSIRLSSDLRGGRRRRRRRRRRKSRARAGWSSDRGRPEGASERAGEKALFFSPLSQYPGSQHRTNSYIQFVDLHAALDQLFVSCYPTSILLLFLNIVPIYCL